MTRRRWAATSNVGLMAQQAEEYGSHDKTFEIAGDGVGPGGRRRRRDAARARRRRPATSGACARPRTRRSRTGCGWPSRGPAPPARRRCSGSTRPVPTTSSCWRRSARRSTSSTPTGSRSRSSTSAPRPASRSRGPAPGEDTISVTGNVLRDYLTDLFPILELGTSAKMLSIVPLMKGGGLFETGAGGSAPKHVQQFVRENHLRWDSLGEFLALAVSLRAARRQGRQPARQAARRRARPRHRHVAGGESLALAPRRRARQPRQPLLPGAVLGPGARRPARGQRAGEPLRRRLPSASPTTSRRSSAELAAVQGSPVDVGGYYRPDPERVAAAMRPSKTLNEALAALGDGRLTLTTLCTLYVYSVPRPLYREPMIPEAETT